MKRLILCLLLAPCRLSAAQLQIHMVQMPLTPEAVSMILPQTVVRALDSGDAVSFYKAVRSGYELPRGDDYQQRLAQEGAERLAADSAYRQLAHWRPDQRDTKIDYEEFGRLHKRWSASADPYRDIEVKRKILIGAGYDVLKRQGKKPVPTISAADARIGWTYQHTVLAYARWRKRAAASK